MPDEHTLAQRLTLATCAVDLSHGALRRLTLDGVEVVRLIDHPIRDADWRTLPLITDGEQLNAASASYTRAFHTADASIDGQLQVQLRAVNGAVQLEADLTLTARSTARVSRAGFVLLHPLRHVVGQPLDVRGTDGIWRSTRFPEHISPGQPVFDIAGLRHTVGPVQVEIAFEGDVFEMEDQRNWTDASFKTYCRPLSRPRPFDIAVGETVRQRITVMLRRAAGTASISTVAADAADSAVMPAITLAHEAALCPAPDTAVLSTLGVQGVLLRVNSDDARPDATVRAMLPNVSHTLELVTGASPAQELQRVADACAAAGIEPARVIALPRPYLASHQPDGPWPGGARPMDLPALVRAAFPGAACGGGMLTNFTEFNRCRPDPGLLDYVTFGTTAIVHAADDDSVLETLEALGDVFTSARSIAGATPLHLGLMSIGMRSNPYGAAVADNPRGARLAMAMNDPRQPTAFAATFAVAIAAAAARGRVASFAPAMTSGPLGMGGGRDGGLYPLFHIVAALAALAGSTVVVRGAAATGLITIMGSGKRGIAGVAANLGPGAAMLDGAALGGAALSGSALRSVKVLPLVAAAASDPHWIDQPGQTGRITLGPQEAAVLKQ